MSPEAFPFLFFAFKSSIPVRGHMTVEDIERDPQISTYIRNCAMLGGLRPGTIASNVYDIYGVLVDKDDVGEYVKRLKAMEGPEAQGAPTIAGEKPESPEKSGGHLEDIITLGTYHKDIFEMQSEGHGADSIVKWLRDVKGLKATKREIISYVQEEIDPRWNGRGHSFGSPTETHGL
jgi:hypothetical protein